MPGALPALPVSARLQPRSRSLRRSSILRKISRPINSSSLVPFDFILHALQES